MNPIVNEVVLVKSPRNGTFHGVVINRRTITRGRNAGKWEYQVSPLEGKHKGKGVLKVIGAQYFREPTKSFEDSAKKQGKDEGIGVLVQRNEVQAERRERNWDNLGHIYRYADPVVTENFAVGERAVIRFRDGAVRKIDIVDINTKTGKVAVHAPRNKSGKRWLHPHQIVRCEVIEQAPPFEVTEEIKAEVNAEGFAVVSGPEMSSYTVAKTREDAYTKGVKRFRLDPAHTHNGLYWVRHH